MPKEIYIEDIKYLFSKREKDTNKGDFGKVGILGGSINYSGAIKLATMSLASLRSGCGLVKVIIPDEIVSSLSPILLEQILFPYKNLEDIKKSIKDLDSLAIGMGWGSNENHLPISKDILENFQGNLVIDADGLNTLVNHVEILRTSQANIVLTPHLKEFSRLTNLSIEEIEKNKIEIAKSFANENHIILLLKGSTTIITNGSDVYLTNYGTPGMATSGSGDVLSGILAGLLGYLKYNLISVSAGAIINGLAGELAEEKNTDIGMIARDTISYIPDAIKKIRNAWKEKAQNIFKTQKI